MQAPETGVIAYAKQNDKLSRRLSATLKDGAVSWTPPTGAAAAIRYSKPDGTGGFYDVLEDSSPAIIVSGNVALMTLAEQCVTVPGQVRMELNFYTSAGAKLTSFTWLLNVEASVLTDATIVSSSYYNVLTAQVAQTLQYKNDAAASAESAAASAALAQQISQQGKGWFATDTALKAAFPTGQNGWWAIVGAGDNIWTWDADTNAWVNTHTQTDLSNYYTKAQTDAAFLGKTATAASATKLVTPRKIGDEYFDGTKDITLAQMGIDLADTNYTITPASNVASAGFAALSKNAIKGIRYKISFQVTKSVVVGSGNVLGTTNALLNADINLSVPCYVSQQGVGVYMGVLLFGTDKSIMLLCEHALTYTTGATYPIMVYACNQ